MLENLNKDSFAEHLNSKFQLQFDPSNSLELELVEAEDTGTTPKQERFSIVFRGPQEPLLQQSIYLLEHERMGQLEIFLVPISSDEEGSFYEAVFNRPIQ